MSGLVDEDGVDGPFDRAMDRAMREDFYRREALYGGLQAARFMRATLRQQAPAIAAAWARRAARAAHLAGVGR